ncbi:MAG: alcohol dehydrogenase catalytic domain-containing protein, partial [Solirubrobacterales bacterium]|nr:alcohol dehydrogenase catalytic domain-containing protein [Solirubrobacterales bacterium]
MNVRAAVTQSKGAPFTIQEVELDQPREDEALVHMEAAGMCHTDLIIRDQWYPVPLPAVLGHEGAGVVEAVGAAVTKVAPGDRVAMSYGSCGACVKCQAGRPWVCHDFWGRNFAAARGRHERPPPRRRGHPLTLLQPVQLRHLCDRHRAQRDEAGPIGAARCRGTIWVRRPDGCGSGDECAPAKGRHQHGRLRDRHRRPSRGHGRPSD